MVPQNEVVGIDLNDSWDDILSVIRHSTYTRLPVFRDSIDDVTGLLHLKAVVQSGSLENLDCDRLEKLVEEPYFVPDGTPLNKQLVQFQRSRQRTAFIVDEYGDIRGIVTLEDILEEIIGEFTSESAPPVHTDVQPDTSGGYVVNAAANVRALNRTMNWHLPTDGPKTLNGLILEQLEIIPERGAGLVLNDYEIEILETGENVVKAVRIREPRQSTQALAG
jgi:Mg2+/Co2+ transporter CorB